VQASAGNLKRLQLELGGKSPDIVFADADLDAAVPGAAMGVFSNSGQVCYSGTRLFVQRAVQEEFIERLKRFCAGLKVGKGLEPDVDLGPLISSEAAHRVEDQVGRYLRNGLRLKLGGRRYQPWGLEGHFFQPTLLLDGRAAGDYAHEDVLGPVIILAPVAGVAAALGALRAARPPAVQGADVALYGASAAAVARELEAAGAVSLVRPAQEPGDGPSPPSRRVLRAATTGIAGGAAALAVEAVSARQPWWFPYANRRRRRS